MKKKMEEYYYALKKNAYRYATDILKYFKGKPFVLNLRFYVIKLAFTDLSKKKLKREVKNSHKAANSSLFSEVVVTQSLPVSFIATSKYYNDSKNVRDKFSKMINFSIQQFANLEITKEEARKVLGKQLSINTHYKSSPTVSKLNKLISNRFFKYEIPKCFMHGDYAPENVIIFNDRLYLVDWEHASMEGSIIYDWWFCRRMIQSKKVLVAKSDNQRFHRFLKDSLSKLKLSLSEFNAFGHAMYAIINCSRLESRKFNDKMLFQSLDRANSIINS